MKSKFFLGGGTAVALRLGHRESIDFDFFQSNSNYLDEKFILDFERKYLKDKKVLENLAHQRNIVTNGVKISYIAYPFKIDHFYDEGEYFKIPSLEILAAMKAYAIGRRGKWKDYVDIYFLIKKLGVDVIIKTAKKIFGTEFSAKLFIRQIGYFDDIDYSEKVKFSKGYEVSKDEIEKFLKEVSIKYVL